MLFVRLDSNLDYCSGPVGLPDGVDARITRLAPNLDFDAAITVPGDNTTLPVSLLEAGTPIAYDRIIIHKAFKELHEAETWIARTIGETR